LSEKKRQMSGEVVPVPAKWAKRARINAEGYTAAVRSVEDDPWGYWGELGRRLTWNKPFTQVLTHLESACDITASLRKQPSGGTALRVIFLLHLKEQHGGQLASTCASVNYIRDNAIIRLHEGLTCSSF
jgi:hypothetical protein